MKSGHCCPQLPGLGMTSVVSSLCSQTCCCRAWVKPGSHWQSYWGSEKQKASPNWAVKIFLIAPSAKWKKTLLFYSPFFSGVRKGTKRVGGQQQWLSFPTPGFEAKKRCGKGPLPVANVSISNVSHRRWYSRRQDIWVVLILRERAEQGLPSKRQGGWVAIERSWSGSGYRRGASGCMHLFVLIWLRSLHSHSQRADKIMES